MEPRMWALIIFTILSQMSVGSFLALGVVHFFATRKAGEEEADRLSDRVLLVIILVLGLGLIASLFHLGNPFRSYRAVVNVGSSWLSREVLFGVIFAVLGALFAFLQWRKIGSFRMRNVLAWLAALVGVAHIFSMSRIYMLPTQPAWDSIATPLMFFTTTLLLGTLAMGAGLVANYQYLKRNQPECAEVQCDLIRDILRGVAIIAVFLLGVEMVVMPSYEALLASVDVMTTASASMIIGPYSAVFIARLVLVFIGAGIFGLFLYQNAVSPGRERILENLAYGAFVMVLAAEVLGRFLFYATSVQITL